MTNQRIPHRPVHDQEARDRLDDHDLIDGQPAGDDTDTERNHP